MGIKKFFKVKPPTQEETEANLIDKMNEKGMPTKSGKRKPQIFQAYSQYANDRTQKKVYAPKGYEPKALNNRGEAPFEKTDEEQQQPENPYGDNTINNNISKNNQYSNGDHNNNNTQQNPYSSIESSNSTNYSNPYAGVSTQSSSSNPYGSSSSNKVPENPYSNSSSTNSYTSQRYDQSQRSQQHNPYQSNNETSSGRYQSNAEQQNGRSNPYASKSSQNNARYQPTYDEDDLNYAPGDERSNPYASKPTTYNNSGYQTNHDDDLNYAPGDEEPEPDYLISNQPQQRLEQIEPPRFKPQQQQQQQQSEFDFEDLNADVVREEEEQNDSYGYQPPYQQEQQFEELSPEELAQREEDEEVEKIKNQIRFTKQESVASTRNTLRMARQAEESGKNTAGMIGAQSEVLYNIERNLSLAETQEKLAKDKVKEIHHYNRNILKPSIANPFTKSRRLREQESKIKNDRIYTKLEQEQQRRELANSTNRIKSTLNDDGDGEYVDNVTNKYRREKLKKEAQQYQFEADSEDDEMENEIGENLEEVSKISARLKKIAMTQGEEIDRQNYRIKDIEEKADRLDINVHLDTASLSRAR